MRGAPASSSGAPGARFARRRSSTFRSQAVRPSVGDHDVDRRCRDLDRRDLDPGTDCRRGRARPALRRLRGGGHGAAVDPARRPHDRFAPLHGRARACGAGPRSTRSPSAPGPSCRSGAAGSGAPSRCATPPSRATPTPRPRCGPPSSTWDRARSRPSHRHTQTAFRFVVEGEGVWTNVEGDPVAMRRGDLLLTPGWHFHEHHNTTDHPMAWIDGLDIPLVSQLDAGFFEFGPGRAGHDRHPGPLPGRAALGPPGAAARSVRPRRRRPRWPPSAGRTPTPPSPSSWSWSARAIRGPWGPATRRSASATPAPGATRCAPSARRCTASPPVRPRRPRVSSGPRSGRCSTAPAPCTSVTGTSRWRRATCSPCRRGRACASRPGRTARSTPSASPTTPCTRRWDCTAARPTVTPGRILDGAVEPTPVPRPTSLASRGRDQQHHDHPQDLHRHHERHVAARGDRRGQHRVHPPRGGGEIAVQRGGPGSRDSSTPSPAQAAMTARISAASGSAPSTRRRLSRVNRTPACQPITA